MKKSLFIIFSILIISCSDSLLETPQTYTWDKKVVWLGTSISENYRGEGNNIREKIYNSYPNILGRMLDCEMINNSRRGLASALDPDGTIQIWGSLCASKFEYANPQMNNEGQSLNGGENNRNYLRTYENALLYQNADIYVFDLIPNNETFDTSEWDKFNFETNTFDDSSTFRENRTTYLGSILFLYNELMNDNPLAEVIFVTVYDLQHPGVQNTILAHSQLNAPIINLRQRMIDYGYTYETVDGSHPTQATVNILGELLYEAFNELYFD